MDTKEWKDVKNLISSLLISSPLQLTIRTLNNDFRNEIGYSIPYEKFGFRTLEQCLDNMTDVLERNGSYISVCVSSKSAHIDKLVQRQMVPSNRRSKTGSSRRQAQRRHTLMKYENYNATDTSFYNKPSSRMIPSLFPKSGTLMSQPKRYSETYTPQPVRRNTSISTTNQPSCNIFTNMRDTNASNVISKPLPETNDLRPAKSEPRLTSASNIDLSKQEKHPTKNEDTSQRNKNVHLVINSRVPLDVQRNLISLINKFDNGIWCAKLPEIYQLLYKKELDYTKYGYKNLILMCMELEKIFYCYRPHKADFILYDRTKPLPSNFETHFMQPTDYKIKPTEPEAFINTIPKPLYPLNVLHRFDVVPKQFTLCDIKKDDIVEVCVADIYNPGQFFVMLVKYLAELDQLMDAMQTFYLKRGSEFIIPQRMISENLFCVTLYDNEYHRAKIVEVLPRQTDAVKVFCFDYGTMDVVKSSGLYYLHKRFHGLPQQAIEAQLAGIKPPRLYLKEQWSKEASLQFLQLTRDKDLFAQIDNVDRVRQRLDMYLIDDTNGENVYLNDVLVDQGYALLKRQANAINYMKTSNESSTEARGKSHGRKGLLQALKQLYARKH